MDSGEKMSLRVGGGVGGGVGSWLMDEEEDEWRDEVKRFPQCHSM